MCIHADLLLLMQINVLLNSQLSVAGLHCQLYRLLQGNDYGGVLVLKMDMVHQLE